MKKRLIAFGLMLVLIMAMSMTAMAAGTMTSDEQKVLDHFTDVQNIYVGKGLISKATAKENLNRGAKVLTDLDFSAEACNDLNAIIDQWAAELKGASTKQELQAKRDALVNIATGYNSNYFTVSASLDKKTGIGSITITMKGQGGGGEDVPAQDQTTTVPIGQGIINQTGVDTTATVAVIGGVALISLLGVGAFVASRSKKVAR